jgi:hypothetical protein
MPALEVRAGLDVRVLPRRLAGLKWDTTNQLETNTGGDVVCGLHTSAPVKWAAEMIPLVIVLFDSSRWQRAASADRARATYRAYTPSVAATRPSATARRRDAWSLSLSSAYAVANAATARSKTSLFPR